MRWPFSLAAIAERKYLVSSTWPGTRTWRAALACQIVFGVPAHELFPGIYAEVEKIVTERACLLSEQLNARREQDRSRLRKLATLRAIMAEGKQRPSMDNDS